MNNELPLKKIGFISKLNGYKGELVLASDEDDFFDEEFLFMKMDGIPVPFAVEDIFEKGGNAIVRFEDVTDEVHAQRFLKQEVFMEKRKKRNEKVELSIQDLTGYHLIDSTFGDLGPVIRIDEYPQQQIAVCHIKEREVLVPLNNDFIESIDEEKRLVRVNLPAGLIDLYIEK